MLKILPGVDLVLLAVNVGTPGFGFDSPCSGFDIPTKGLDNPMTVNLILTPA